MIRVILGLLIVLGALGTLDIDPDANVLVQVGVALVGLVLMYFGSKKVNNQ